MACSQEQPDWANLPKNIVDLIAEKLVPPLSQFVLFGAVCKPWHAAIMENRLLRSKILEGCHRQVPFLMVPTKDKSQERRGLYNIIDMITYGLELPVPYKRRCCGSSYGWIATLDRTLAVKLIKPFTGGIINLPSIDTSRHETTEDDDYEFYVKKVILSDDPYVDPDKFMIVALFGEWGSIAIIRPGDKTWTYTTSNLEKFVKVDAIFLKGKIYTVGRRHGIISVDVASINGSSSASAFEEKMVIPSKHYRLCHHYLTTYIVESSDGDILIVERYYETSDADHLGPLCIHHVTTSFKVFKLERHIDEARLVEINSTGDDALFLGDNYSISVAASRFPGCRSNSIYFTDDNIDFANPYIAGGPHDMGIFSLQNGCFERYYDLDPSHIDMPPPFFILPTLGGKWVTHLFQ